MKNNRLVSYEETLIKMYRDRYANNKWRGYLDLMWSIGNKVVFPSGVSNYSETLSDKELDRLAAMLIEECEDLHDIVASSDAYISNTARFLRGEMPSISYRYFITSQILDFARERIEGHLSRLKSIEDKDSKRTHWEDM